MIDTFNIKQEINLIKSKHKWRIYATLIRHIQNLRYILRNLQKMKNGVNTPWHYAIY